MTVFLFLGIDSRLNIDRSYLDCRYVIVFRDYLLAYKRCLTNVFHLSETIKCLL